MNDRIRHDGTRALTSAAVKIGVRLYLQQSIVWAARPPDESAFDEGSPTCRVSVYASAVDAEEISREAGQMAGSQVGILRGGAFYSVDSAHTRSQAQLLRRRKLPLIGAGDAIWALTHPEDMSSAFVTAAEAGWNGIWHVVDDQPVTAGGVFRRNRAPHSCPPAPPRTEVAGPTRGRKADRRLCDLFDPHVQRTDSA